MIEKLVIGIDPGKHGAISFASLNGDFRKVFGFSKYTEHDIKNIILEHKEFLGYKLTAFIEDVHAMPKDGKVQAFSFGKIMVLDWFVNRIGHPLPKSYPFKMAKCT
ncbi:MAG: hypothetical protein L6V95_10050 [Candidatus Melainabacteria bacterium]|nr:MAG: hypothetical protein L6V95_10050 [Candidatus Melainabacteria bacterium]